jgi:hypothetical protein
MSVDDVSGYKHVSDHYNARRWQHRLFAEIRTAPDYKSILSRLRDTWEKNGRPGERTGDFTDRDYWIRQPLDRSSAYVDALKKVASDLHLTRNATPVEWAIGYLHNDVLGRFDPDRQPPMVSIAHTRMIEISISAAVASVDTYSGWDEQRVEVRSSQAQHELPMMIGKAEWEKLEALAVEAARQAVADLRFSYEQSSEVLGRKKGRLKAGYEHDRATQIERLALRLMGRAGIRNTPRIDRLRCNDIGIDVPSNR